MISCESNGTFSDSMLGNEGEVSPAAIVAAVSSFTFDHKPIPHFEVVVLIGIDGVESSSFESIGAAE